MIGYGNDNEEINKNTFLCFNEELKTTVYRHDVHWVYYQDGPSILSLDEENRDYDHPKLSKQDYTSFDASDYIIITHLFHLLQKKTNKMHQLNGV